MRCVLTGLTARRSSDSKNGHFSPRTGHSPFPRVAWRCNGQGVRLASGRSRVRSPAVPLSGSNLGAICSHRPTCASVSSKFRTGQEAVMPCGWEGNRRSGVTLAVHHRLQWFIHLRAYGVRKGGEHPAYTPHGVWHSSLFYIPLCGFV